MTSNAERFLLPAGAGIGAASIDAGLILGAACRPIRAWNARQLGEAEAEIFGTTSCLPMARRHDLPKDERPCRNLGRFFSQLRLVSTLAVIGNVLDLLVRRLAFRPSRSRTRCGSLSARPLDAAYQPTLCRNTGSASISAGSIRVRPLVAPKFLACRMAFLSFRMGNSFAAAAASSTRPPRIDAGGPVGSTEDHPALSTPSAGDRRIFSFIWPGTISSAPSDLSQHAETIPCRWRSRLSSSTARRSWARSSPCHLSSRGGRVVPLPLLSRLRIQGIATTGLRVRLAQTAPPCPSTRRKPATFAPDQLSRIADYRALHAIRRRENDL